MIGHRQIIESRMQGKKPSCVFVQYVSVLPKFKGEINNPENALSFGLYPEVWINQPSADVRFLTGCNVIVHGDAWTDSFFNLLDKIVSVNPEIITASANDGEVQRWIGGKWYA